MSRKMTVFQVVKCTYESSIVFRFTTCFLTTLSAFHQPNPQHWDQINDSDLSLMSLKHQNGVQREEENTQSVNDLCFRSTFRIDSVLVFAANANFIHLCVEWTVKTIRPTLMPFWFDGCYVKLATTHSNSSAWARFSVSVFHSVLIIC